MSDDEIKDIILRTSVDEIFILMEAANLSGMRNLAAIIEFEIEVV